MSNVLVDKDDVTLFIQIADSLDDSALTKSQRKFYRKFIKNYLDEVC